MITEKDLRAAIAECEGMRNPNANTCIKLAAFYTILNNLYPEKNEEPVDIGYSTMPSNDNYVPFIQSESEFMNVCSQKDIYAVLGVLNEHMEAIKLLYPKEYDSIIEKIKEI
jgi:hypothetical protein